MTAARFPLVGDYKRAVVHPDRFRTLRHWTIERKACGDSHDPWFIAGAMGVVFRARDPQSNTLAALKCFTSDSGQRLERYRAIGQALGPLPKPPFVPFEILESEIYINSNQSIPGEYPILKMSWVDGVTLGIFVAEACNRQDHRAIVQVIKEWEKVRTLMRRFHIAHGDLKHDNIMVTPQGRLVLVDYDNMYVPALKGLRALEFGSPAFQHPNRDSHPFDETFDAFSSLVLHVSLLALKKDFRLIRFHNKENLIFCSSDFQRFTASPLIKELRNLHDRNINRMLGEMEGALTGRIDPSSLAEQVIEPNITAADPLLVIIALERTGALAIDSGHRVPSVVIAEIVNELIVHIADRCCRGSAIADLVCFSLIQVADCSTHKRLPAPIPVSRAVKAEWTVHAGWHQAYEAIVDQLVDWHRDHSHAVSPVMVAIGDTAAAFPAGLGEPKLGERLPHQRCAVFGLGSRTRGAGGWCAFPAQASLLRGDGFDRDAFGWASPLPKSAKEWLQARHGQICPDGTRSVVAGPDYPSILKLLQSVILGPLAQI